LFGGCLVTYFESASQTNKPDQINCNIGRLL
jgi:hypothetical protein